MDSGSLICMGSFPQKFDMFTGPKRGLSAKGILHAARICFCVLIGLITFLFARDFVIENLLILLPVFATIVIFLYFSLRLRSQIQDNIFGEIGFLYLAFAVAYTVFPAYGILTMNSLSYGTGLQYLAHLLPNQGELGLQLWRQALFIAAIASGYLLFRAGNRPNNRLAFSSIDAFGGAEKLVVCFLFVTILTSIVLLWGLAAPVTEYIDNYTKYANLSWFGTRIVNICTVIKTGGTFVLLTVMFRNYKRYRLYIWPFVLLRVVQEVLDSLGARIEAFTILVAAAVLYHHCVKRISLKMGLLITLTLGVIFSAVEIARFANVDPSVLNEGALQGQGMPAAELGALFVPGFHLYSERTHGGLPPVPWQLFFNDFISVLPLADQTKWNPMYWYAANYFPGAVVPPMTMGPIALSALWGGEIGLFVEGFINGILFAFLMRWFARGRRGWRAMTAYVFCYSTCIMCLKYSILWHLAPLVKIVLPLVLIVTVLANIVQEGAGYARAPSLSAERPSLPSSAGDLFPSSGA
jgi:hypothetical protein